MKSGLAVERRRSANPSDSLRAGISPSAEKKIEAKVISKEAGIKCQRCGGGLKYEKFYGPNDVFFGWRCLICGNIFDPVILLHRVSRDADIDIPETEEQILSLIRKFAATGQMSKSSKSPQREKSRARRPGASAAG